MINLKPEQIKLLRKELNLSYVDLEELSGINRIRLSKIEKYLVIPKNYELYFITKTLNELIKLIPPNHLKRRKCPLVVWTKNRKKRLNEYYRAKYESSNS